MQTGPLHGTSELTFEIRICGLPSSNALNAFKLRRGGGGGDPATIDPAERILIIEDTRELQLDKPHVVQMEARPADAYGKGQITVRDLFRASLRMRPDGIVVGEVRGGEALDLVGIEHCPFIFYRGLVSF